MREGGKMDYRAALKEFAELVGVSSHALKRMTEAEKALGHAGMDERLLDELLEIAERLKAISSELRHQG